jgi:hypothetical protein
MARDGDDVGEVTEFETHPRDPWRYHRAEQEGCEALLAAALDSLGLAVDPSTRAAILADTGLAAGRVMDATVEAYGHGLAGDVTRARRELRLLRDPVNARARLVRSLDLYRDELGSADWDRVVQRLALELIDVYQATQKVLVQRLQQGTRVERRVVAAVGRGNTEGQGR